MVTSAIGVKKHAEHLILDLVLLHDPPDILLAFHKLDALERLQPVQDIFYLLIGERLESYFFPVPYLCIL